MQRHAELQPRVNSDLPDRDAMTLARTCIFLLLLLLPQIAAAQECAECIDRKRSMCAAECRLVPPEKAVQCQKDCTWQYCTHRCDENDPALVANSYSSCSACLDHQFNLCEPNCPTGTDRYRSMCQLGCAKQRCGAWCTSAVSPSSAPPSPDPIKSTASKSN